MAIRTLPSVSAKFLLNVPMSIAYPKAIPVSPSMKKTVLRPSKRYRDHTISAIEAIVSMGMSILSGTLSIMRMLEIPTSP